MSICITTGLLTLMSQEKVVDKVALDFYQQSFVIRKGDVVMRVPIIEEKPSNPVKMFRKNDTYSVWDSRGLSTRVGERYRVTRYPEIAVSPRVFPREEILRTIEMLKTGQRTKDAAALSGSARIGSMTYFLLRWEEKGGKPWAEALVRVNLDSPKPEPQLVGKFPGLSRAEGQIDEQLVHVKDRLHVVTRQGNAWGVATYDPKKDAFDFFRLGEGLSKVRAGIDGFALGLESAPYGATVVVKVDLINARRLDLTEGRAKGNFLDSLTPELFVRQESSGRALCNLASGAEVPLGEDTAVRRVGKMILTWSPPTSPKQATLWDPERWSQIAAWVTK